ncbi:hypothetical protein ACLOAU_05925 [Niabella sp. CJ426]|uniref:hypothetical protein n=1 Tax=Niabella sp. CJ426 TaxID=3393740 RepID=UPI003D04151F
MINRLFLVWIVLLFNQTVGASNVNNVPKELQSFVKNIDANTISGVKPRVSFKTISKNLVYVSVVWQLERPAVQDSVAIKIIPAFAPGFHWAPHLTPNPNSIIAQHVFRAPAMLVSNTNRLLVVLPDLDLLKKPNPVPWYMDVNAPDNYLELGMSKSRVEEHVLYVRDKGAVFPAGELRLGFYVMVSNKSADIQNPWRGPLQLMWSKWGQPLYQAGEPLHQTNLEPYVKQTYNWAFNSWKPAVWQEFELNGKQVGAPVFIVNVTQSPNYQAPVDEREFRSVWNQAWFNSLRSAQGLYRYAKRTNDDTLKDRALKTKELALSFPQQDGLFKSVIATEMEEVTISGKKYRRSKGWDTRYFGNSNRNPFTWDAKQSPYHIADMSYTAYWMMVWYDELEKDERLIKYARQYADALLALQDKEGFFPAWLSLDTHQPMGYLDQSPETSLSVTFLLKMFKHTGKKEYLASARKALDAVVKHIVPVGQWEDFETYWSCSRVGSQDWVGKKIPRNNMFKQNNFSIYWTAEALLDMYKTTGNKSYLQKGQRTLDELLMFQATWQPPYMAIRTLGGFGVMNADGEWNDSRQCLFAGLIIDYGKLLKSDEYIQRGLSALRASFTMMYTPLNPQTMKQWQAKWPFFGSQDYGFMMENYGHGGETNDSGLGIGEFTIYDWGNGAAAEAYNRLLDKYGPGIFRDK